MVFRFIRLFWSLCSRAKTLVVKCNWFHWGFCQFSPSEKETRSAGVTNKFLTVFFNMQKGLSFFLFFYICALLLKFNLLFSDILTEMIDTFSLRVIPETASDYNVYSRRRNSDFSIRIVAGLCQEKQKCLEKPFEVWQRLPAAILVDSALPYPDWTYGLLFAYIPPVSLGK